ncbi:MAG: hypothetical protein P9X24_04455 [Candidatus Hatepunaea meridiana]|nr:hypothetical protein [Candidatus Hatepunaea meridiana]
MFSHLQTILIGVALPIPDFNKNGELPPGIHQTNLGEIVSRLDTNSPRHELIAKLTFVIKRLATIGIKRVYIDGSFITDKIYPKDIDGCWVDNKDIDWDNDSEMDFMLEKPTRMKKRWRIELYKSINLTSIRDKKGNFWKDEDANVLIVSFLEFFQFNRDREPKGILCLDI